MRLKKSIQILLGLILLVASIALIKFGSSGFSSTPQSHDEKSRELLKEKIARINDPWTKILAQKVSEELFSNSVPLNVNTLRIRNLSKEAIKNDDLASIFNKSNFPNFIITIMDESATDRLIEIKIENNNELINELNLRIKR